MAINFQGLRTVGFKTNNLAEAKNWYTQLLGIPPYFDEPFYVGFNVAGYELGLQPEEKPADSTTPGSVAYWGVENVQTAFDLFIRMGATPLEQPTDVGGDIVVASVLDPWGNALGIIYNPHFKLA